MMRTLTIGAVAKQADLRTSAIRYYESAGVLPPPRRVSGQRRYSSDVFMRLAIIRAARELGFSMAELRELFQGFPAETEASTRWHQFAARKMTELDDLIAHAVRRRSMLADGAQPSGSVR
jgi:MerR family redox-sensitive transcriptional activator SoxR